MVQISSKNSKLFLSVRSQLTVIDLTLQTKGQPMDIEHKMNMAVDIMKFIFESQQLFRIPIWFIMILYYKIRQILLQNKTFILLKIVKITTKCVRFLLQNVIVLLQNATVLLQIVGSFKILAKQDIKLHKPVIFSNIMEV